MTDTVTVASRVPMALTIQEPLPAEFKDKPGEAPLLQTAVINGANHGEAKGNVGFTHNVNAAMFKAWHELQVKGKTALADLVSIVSPEEAENDDPVEYGHEIGLKRMAEASENTAAAEKGSTMTHEGPATATEMRPTSDTPNDDTPRGDPDITPVAHSETPATSEVAP